jgi:hypothetical protein
VPLEALTEPGKPSVATIPGYGRYRVISPET